MSVQSKTHTRKFYQDLVLEYLKNNPGSHRAKDIHEALKEHAVNNDIRVAILDLIVINKLELLENLRLKVVE